MELKITGKHISFILLLISWIIFVGLCIEAGAFITNAIFVLTNPKLVPRLWQQVDLSALFKYDHGYFFVTTLLLSIISILKAWLFFLIIKLLHNKKLSIARPFNQEVRRFLFLSSYISLLIGLFSSSGVEYAEWLMKQGVQMPNTESLNLGGADVWLFMTVILFVIAQIFKRGIEIQSENDLTV